MLRAILLLIAAQGAATTPNDAPARITLANAHRYERARLVDQFAEARVDRSVIGRAFRIVAPFGDGNARVFGGVGGAGYYTYDGASLRLVIRTDERGVEIGGPRRLVATFSVHRNPGQSYVGSNALGARAHVSVMSVEEDGLALLSRPTGLPSPYSANDPLRNDPLNHYWTEVPLSGPSARQLALRARVVIEGTVRELPNGGLTECRRNYGGPTVASPREVFIQSCWVGADVARIAIIDARDGSILREWVRND